jgi:CRP/FNR family transcriptional regulator
MIEQAAALVAFPFLRSVPRGSRDALLSAAVVKTLEHRQILVSGGGECSYLPLVMEGTLRVYKLSESGRELTLYRIERGESCILTATCILNDSSFPAIAESEGHSAVALVPAKLIVRLVDEHAEWRRFVFGLYARRLDAMFTLVEEVAFHHIDSRIASLLLGSSGGADSTVRKTHAQIAAELATSREVVSRILKDFEADGLVQTLRGGIRILDADRLEARGIRSPPV